MELEKILILGDGNFSFSLALSKLVELFELKNYSITCTSFDSNESLCLKYPEVIGILTKLSKFSNVQIAHDINAVLLENYFKEKFHQIIFNFPHLSSEDVILHQRFLKHLVYKFDQFLTCDGTFVISLAQSQQISWKLIEIAESFGFVLKEKYFVDPSQWPGYELKRHHNGKSFKSRVLDCYQYLFKRKESIESQTSLLEVLYSKINLMPKVLTISELSSSSILSDSSSQKQDKNTKPSNKKKRKVHELVQGLYTTEAIKDLEGRLLQKFICSQCSKDFSTEQGIRTHVYNVHVLNSSISDDAPSQLLQCSSCDKTFPNSDALYQHQIAKHSSSEIPKFQSISSNDLSTAAEIICSICEEKFMNQDELQRHQSGDFLPKDQEHIFSCPNCAKTFTQPRAFDQHSRFCFNAVGKTENTGSIS